MNSNLQNIISVLAAVCKSAVRTIFRPPLINYFGTSYKKHALLSYVTTPFRNGLNIGHTNSFEAPAIAKIINEAGFNVDIVDYNYDGNVDYSKYQLIFGFGDPIVNSFTNRKNKITTVYYGTGMHVNTQNMNTLNRITDVHDKKGVWLPESGRIVEKAWSIQTTITDSMVLLGNTEVTKTYAPYFKNKIYNVPASFFEIVDYKEIIAKKDFSNAKKNFLWFGSDGMIHKGLDLLLEIFSTRNDIHLHICGPLDKEPRFKKTFSEELYKRSNIHVHGFLSLNSELFLELLDKCAFVIFPSCSEGGSPSVLNICGNGGLIPLVSKEASIDIDDFGFIFNNVDHENISRSIDEVLKMDVSILKEKSIKCGSVISERHSQTNFVYEFKNCLKEILKGI